MKFETTPVFDADYRRLNPQHRREFKDVIATKFAFACDQWAAATRRGQPFVWPASLRVSMLKGTRGVYEMTWSFAAPDGRATFELVGRDDEWVCRWRRVGDHAIFNHP